MSDEAFFDVMKLTDVPVIASHSSARRFTPDFDSVGDSLPTGLKDISDYPNLIFVLLRSGYTVEEIEKICSGNLLRVWRDVIGAAG